MAIPETISGLFTAAISDPARPILTFYDDATGERTELSGATLGNWVSKTANMITDGAGLGHGDVASVGLPPHWQSAAVMLGCWAAGLEVAIGRSATSSPADVAFVTTDDAVAECPAADRYALGLHPMALPLKIVPDGYLDFTSEVRAFGDHYQPARAVRPEDPAFAGRTHAQVCHEAAEWGVDLGLTGGRVLINADQHPDPVQWLVAPLAAGSSIVLCRNVDQSKIGDRVTAERVNLVIG